MSMINIHDIPGEHRVQIGTPIVASSAATNYIAVLTVPFACTVTGIDFVCTDAVTGANTNTVHLNVDNSAGTEIANIDLVSGTDLTAGTASALTLTSTSANLDLAAGATLRLEAEEIGTGLGAAIAEGVLVVKFRAN
ncbi:MAG: hypothetical protein ACE5IR_09550 [bacterium]